MQHHTTSSANRIWNESGHGSLCVLGVHLPLIGFFQPLEAQVKIGIGIGAGFIINGYLYHGDTKAAGELGSLRA